MTAIGNYEVVTGSYGPFTDSSVHTVTVPAPTGKVVLGGGLRQDLTSPAVQALIAMSYPDSTGANWIFQIRGQGSALQPAQGDYFVTCAQLGQ